MSLSLATKGILGEGNVGMATMGILHQESGEGDAPIVVAPTVAIYPGLVGGGGGSWSGERVGWWPIGKKVLDGELLSVEESKRLQEPEEELFTFTRVVFEEETYVFEEAGPRLLAGDVDEEYGSSYVPQGQVEAAPTAPSEPPDWQGLLLGAFCSFAAGSLVGRVHPALSLVVGVGGAWVARNRPWALGGVLLGAPLALATAVPNVQAKPQAVAKRKTKRKRKVSPKARKRIRMKIQRVRVYGKRKR